MIDLDFGKVLFLLLMGHALADYPLQGDFIAKGKDRNTDIGKMFWPYCLSAHAFIQGGFVLLITGSLWMAVAEAAIHARTDWQKCEKKISLFQDQLTHGACKLAWALFWWWGWT